MPLVYGEGPKAFLRLQEEILRQSDHTLFAWRVTSSDSQVRGLFASSPQEFSHYFDGYELHGSTRQEHLIRLWNPRLSREPMVLKNKGIHITGQVRDLQPTYDQYDTIILLLNCCFGGNPGYTVGIYLRRQDENRYARIRPDELPSVDSLSSHIPELKLYGLKSTTDVRGHYYHQPWTSSYQIRRELWETEHSKFEDIRATKSRYHQAFYIKAKDLKLWTLFGCYRLHGVLMVDSRGLLCFFRFDPDERRLDMVLKTYPGFHMVLLYKSRNDSGLILAVLGRKASEEGQDQHWVTAAYLSG
ncbi:hypothetical protein F66182_3841 [Fusarium sp. NRRL 66182]|nr:hypothetical protein F66182_3841 [Fusarium sp. NRRL 66182]